jgi:GT2 family glycosyltransferase
MNPSPKITIIVLSYNGGNLITRCLGSVWRLHYPNISVVVVDNHSTDGSFEMIRKNFPRSDYIRNQENLGYSAGNNIGIRFALERGADYVLLLNQDAVVPQDFIERLLAAAEEDSRSGIFSPVITEGEASTIWFAGARVSYLRMKALHERRVRSKKPYYTGYITGCAMLVRRQVFERIGLLDEDFFLYWEDADFCLRAKKAGFTCLMVPDAKAAHFEKSQENRSKKDYWLVISGLIFFKKHTSFLLIPWIGLYYNLRKIKNWVDVRFLNREGAQVVRKAYQDFDAYGAR